MRIVRFETTVSEAGARSTLRPPTSLAALTAGTVASSMLELLGGAVGAVAGCSFFGAGLLVMALGGCPRVRLA